jgi:hypothetical protein
MVLSRWYLRPSATHPASIIGDEVTVEKCCRKYKFYDKIYVLLLLLFNESLFRVNMSCCKYTIGSKCLSYKK